MNKKEFRKEALKLGWTDKMIDEQIEMTERLVGENGDFDYLVFLVELPINDLNKRTVFELIYVKWTVN